MSTLVKVGLFFSAIGCLLAEAKLETYRNLLNQAEAYSVPAPKEPEKAGRIPRIMEPHHNHPSLVAYRARCQAHNTWRQEQDSWEVAYAQHHMGEINRLVESQGSYIRMLEELGLRQTLKLLLEARYFVRPHPEVPSSVADPRSVFQDAVREFGRRTPTVGYAVEGISASLEIVRFALVPFIEGLLTGSQMQRFFESGEDLESLASAFRSVGVALPGTGLKFGEQMLLNSTTPEAFLFLLGTERSLAGPTWSAVVERHLHSSTVFRRFYDLAPTEKQWAQLLKLWPASNALATLEANRIWVSTASQWKLRIRSCVEYLQDAG